MTPLIKLVERPDEDDPNPQPANVMITYVGVNTLKPAPWNPEKRTTKASLKPLMKRIEEEGFDPYRPILVSRDGFIGDGHRRWSAAKILGMSRVPVVFTDRSVEDLWAGNAGGRAVSAREWMAVSVIGGVIAPERQASIIAEMRPVMGDEGLRYLIERGVSPGIWRLTWRVGLYCKRKDNAFLRKTTYWLVKHKMSDKVQNRALSGPDDERIQPRVLIQAIENDLPLRVTWEFDQSATA